MKKLKIAFLLSALFMISPMFINAQIRVNINIGSQPIWGPEEYDYVEYYYMPEFGIYYNVPRGQYVYQSGNRWVFTSNLPFQFRHINLFNTYKVVINEQRPYLRHNYYTNHYKKYRNYHARQVNRRDSHNPRYNKGQNSRRESPVRMSKPTQNRHEGYQSSPRNDNNRNSRVEKTRRSNMDQRSQGNKGDQRNRGNQSKQEKQGKQDRNEKR